MNKKISALIVATLILTGLPPAWAQQPKKIARVGYLGNTASTSATSMKPFHERLRDLGYIEGQNIAIEYRYFDGKVERLPELAAELVRLNCDVIVAIGNEAAGAAKNATKEIPIVMASTNDAVRSGFVASLARPGANITGLTSMGGETYGNGSNSSRKLFPSSRGSAFSGVRPVQSRPIT